MTVRILESIGRWSYPSPRSGAWRGHIDWSTDGAIAVETPQHIIVVSDRSLQQTGSIPGEYGGGLWSPDGRTLALSRRDEDLGVLEFIDVGEFSAE